MRSRRTTLILALALAFAIPAHAYTVFLKDGSKIAAQEAPTLEGDKAIIILQNGTRTSIDATEIDFELTRESNGNDYGSATILEDGRMTEIPSSAKAPKRETLADLIAKRGDAAASPPVPRRRPSREDTSSRSNGAPGLDFRSLQRRPFNDLEAASEVRRLFRAQGVDEILIYQGSESAHLLLEIICNSEASVFRSLEAAASVLTHLDQQGASVNGFELVLATSQREPAGQFLMTRQTASLLVDNELEPSAFFVDHVRF